MTNGGVASPVTSSGATRASRRSSSSAAKPVTQSTLLRLHQSNQDDSEAELQGTPATRQKLDAKGSSIPAERQRVKGREGSSERPAGSPKGNESRPERQEGEQQPMSIGQEAGVALAAPSIAEANYVWVQCDLCSKWRELPKGHTVSQQPLLLTPHPSRLYIMLPPLPFFPRRPASICLLFMWMKTNG